MINNIQSVIMDFTNLKTKSEINNYILNQLEKEFPEPALLTFEYYITKSRYNKKAIVSYIPTESLEKTSKRKIEHPHILLKQIINKDGHYIIFYSNRILEVEIDNKCLLKVNNISINDIGMLELVEKSVLISDENNLKIVKKLYGRNILNLKYMYKKCNQSLFYIKKRKHYKILIFIPLVILGYFLIIFFILFKNNQLMLNDLKITVDSLKIKSTNQINIEKKYEEILNKIYIIESQKPDDLYTALYNLEKYGKEYKIIDFNYSNGSLNINAITKNSISLITDLNRSKYFSFNHKTTITKGNYEQVNFSGILLCP